MVIHGAHWYAVLRLFPDGIALSAPPCSLYGPACASVHKRSFANVRGDLGNFKVRLARTIWCNFVSWLHGFAWNFIGSHCNTFLSRK